MKLTMNITATGEDLDRYESADDLHRFYHDRGLAGLELMLCGCRELPDKVTAGEVVGIHLRYWPCWLDFWRGDVDALRREYGDDETWKAYYGPDREAFLAPWREELEMARRVGAEYVVFHVSECTLEETVTYRFRHTDEEVCDAACEIINALLDGQEYDFHFLVENLWWSGLNLQQPAVTARMMEGIHYPKKGIMLDTGHLMHTNHAIGTQAQAVDYIHRVLDDHGELCRYVRGVHLNQSISGEYVESVIAQPPKLVGTYWERARQIFPHVYKIDFHQPFTDPGVAGLLRRIGPEFVTLEFISPSAQAHGRMLDTQLRALRENGGME